jgi:hypothetical protein
MPNIDEILGVLQSRLDKAAATGIATEDPKERDFILEATFGAVALFLLEKYCDGFLEGLGLSEVARSHGERVRKFLLKIRSKALSKVDIETEKRDAQSLVNAVVVHSGKTIGTEKGERAVEDLLHETGATKGQGRRAAEAITAAIFGDHTP